MCAIPVSLTKSLHQFATVWEHTRNTIAHLKNVTQVSMLAVDSNSSIGLINDDSAGLQTSETKMWRVIFQRQHRQYGSGGVQHFHQPKRVVHMGVAGLQLAPQPLTFILKRQLMHAMCTLRGAVCSVIELRDCGCGASLCWVVC